MKVQQILGRLTLAGSLAARSLMAVVVSLATLGGEALGLEPSIEFPGGAPPTALAKDSDGEVLPLIVVAQGAEIRSAPKKTASVVRRAEYLEQYFVAESETSSGQKYYLAAEKDLSDSPSRFIGWLAERDVLTTRRAIKSRPGIYLKGLIVNQWRKAGDEGVDIAGAPSLNGPGVMPGATGAPYERVAELGLFQFYYVFKQYDAPDVGKTYYLLSDGPVLRNVTQPGEFLVGWVDKERIVDWDTRQAIEFDKSTLKPRTAHIDKAELARGVGGAKIFETEEELRAFMKGDSVVGPAKIPVEPVAEEDPTVTSWPHTLQRFPLFGVKENPVAPTFGALYNVGFVGDQIYVTGEVGADAREMADAQNKLEVLKESLNSIDILFAIDSTGSMTNYFQAAADAVRTIMGDINREHPVGSPSRPEIRFSVLFYRDYADEDGEPNPSDTYLVKRQALTGNVEALGAFLELEVNAPCSGCGGDEPEAVFHAIDRAIGMAAREVASSGFRAIVVVGDKGNHRRDERGHSVESIAKTIIDEDYDFFDVHVVSREAIASDPEARLFREQMDAIRKLVAFQVTTNSEEDQFTSDDPHALAQELVRLASAETTAVKEAREAVRKISRGEAGLVQIKSDYGVRLSQRLSRMMAELDVRPEIFVEKSVSVFDQGWMTELDAVSGERQIREMLLLERATLEQLTGVLAGFVREPPSRESVTQMWEQVLKQQIGEVNVEKTVAELLEAYLGIPVRKKMLHRTLAEIAQLQPEQLADLWGDLEFDLYRLRSALSEKELDITKTRRPTGGYDFDVNELGTRTLFWRGKSAEFAWLPLEEMP